MGTDSEPPLDPSSGPPGTRPQRPIPVPLAQLADELGARVVGDSEDVAVTGVTLSSHRVRPGDLYAAVPGSRRHGIEFAGDALSSGAVAVLTDADGAARGTLPVPMLVVPEPRRGLGPLAARVYGQPARALRMIGVTGTQGKTTTTMLAEQGLTVAGVPAATIGTIGTRINGTDVRTSLTTPEAPDLHGLFAVMRERGTRVCAMEVSSHALVLGRVDGVVFDVAVFLNLGRDHLDFHRDLDDYFTAKASLFDPLRCRLALVNVDDPYGRRLAEDVAQRAALPLRTFSASGRPADWMVSELEASATGSRFRIHPPSGASFPAGCAVPGDFNVANTLAAVAACSEAGLDAPAVARGIAGSGGVPGRLERVDEGQDFAVLVDYAHKPDAVAAALGTVRPLTEGRVILVLGAGGDRDPGKRSQMGQIAAAHADLLVITDDNPRTEEPAAIRAELRAGAAGPAELHEIGDRRAAIREAVRLAAPGDLVLIAGKGHETGQEVDGVIHPFDDREVAREALRLRSEAGEAE